MEVDAPSPEIAARNSLLQLIDIIKGDSEPLVSQLKYEPSYDLDKDWEDIKQKIHNREYTTYSSLALDLQKILDSVLSASKKNIKQQRPYSLSHKNIKKQLDQYERFMRARLYEWHPGGKQAAAKVLCPPHCLYAFPVLDLHLSPDIAYLSAIKFRLSVLCRFSRHQPLDTLCKQVALHFLARPPADFAPETGPKYPCV